MNFPNRYIAEAYKHLWLGKKGDVVMFDGEQYEQTGKAMVIGDEVYLPITILGGLAPINRCILLSATSSSTVPVRT